MESLPEGYETTLPAWVREAATEERYADLNSRMELVIRCSRLNWRHGTGGPFAAAVFETETGRLVSIGVNRVVPLHQSSAHAEIVALSLAQVRCKSFDLGAHSLASHQLVVNGRPCAMCFGAIPWSGIRSLVIGASGEDIERLTGFDEGPIHPDWKSELTRRGIEVLQGIQSKEACQVLREFAASDPVIYNGRST